MRALYESVDGSVFGTGGASTWDAKFKDGSDWIDVSSFVGIPVTITDQTFL
jgi:hypothetical protein